MEYLNDLNLEYRTSENMGPGQWLWPKDDYHCWDYFNKDERKRFRYKNISGYHLPHDIVELLPIEKKNLVIQAGGNSGLYASIYSKYFKTVLTFEPDYRWFCCLAHNARQPNVFKYNAALGNDNIPVSIETPLLHDTENLGGLYVKDNGIIPKLRIDDFGVSPDLIHLDIEGAEWSAIEGAVETIKRSKPIIVVEWDKNSMTRFGWSIESVNKLFFDLGYAVSKEWKRDKAFTYLESQ
tara:strand:- start:15 stop:728 length:714 start_codon:yes stop_codon:yes gene_type:complete